MRKLRYLLIRPYCYEAEGGVSGGISQKLVLRMILSVFPLDKLQKEDLMQLLESN